MCCRKLSTFILSLSKVHGDLSLDSFGWSPSIRVAWKFFPQTHFVGCDSPPISHKDINTAKINLTSAGWRLPFDEARLVTTGVTKQISTNHYI